MPSWGNPEQQFDVMGCQERWRTWGPWPTASANDWESLRTSQARAPTLKHKHDGSGGGIGVVPTVKIGQTDYPTNPLEPGG